MTKKLEEVEAADVTRMGRPTLRSGLHAAKAARKKAPKRFSGHVSAFLNGSTEPKKLWQQKQIDKAAKQAAREAEQLLRDKRKNELKKRSELRRLRAEKKRENEVKSLSVQVIKNTDKIRKWSHKAKKTLMKMSPEMIQQLTQK